MKGYRFSIPYSVRISDINYAAHVSNAAVMNFFQDARIAYLDHLGGFSERDIGGDCGIIMPEARVRYLAEMLMGDVLLIGVRIDKLGGSSFEMSYRIERDGEATAEGTTPLVAFDYRTRKVRRLPADFRTRAAALEGLE